MAETATAPPEMIEEYLFTDRTEGDKTRTLIWQSYAKPTEGEAAATLVAEIDSDGVFHCRGEVFPTSLFKMWRAGVKHAAKAAYDSSIAHAPT